MSEDDEAIAWFDREAEAYAKHLRPSERLTDFLGLLAPRSRVLDAGAGPGVDANEVALRGHDVVALDAAPGMVAVARRRFRDLHVLHGDIRALPFAPGSFDGLLALYVLMFLSDTEIATVLRAFAGLLAHGGALLVAVQGPRHGPGESGLRAMTMEHIAGAVAAAGFGVLRRFDRSPRPYEMQHRKLYVLAHKL